jgi:rSAM/selenodomain-associated transferase 1
LKDTLRKTAAIQAERFLYLAGSGRVAFDPQIAVRMQIGNDLGARLHHAFEETLKKFDRVVIIGIDSPTLSPHLIEQAYQELENNDVVLGPAEDGGYYLIGLKFLIHEIFTMIDWGTANVLTQTQSALTRFAVCLLPQNFDVDTPGDLVRLRTEIAAIEFAPHTKEWILEHS